MDAVPIAHWLRGMGDQGRMHLALRLEEAGEGRRHHGFGGAGRAILAFQRDGNALFRDGGAEDAFGACFAEDTAGAICISSVQARPEPAT